MESADVKVQEFVTHPIKQLRRAIVTTIGFVLASIVLEIIVGFLILVLILPILDKAASFNEQGLLAVYYFAILLLPILPASLGGMYWLALRGLQRKRLRFVWREVTGLGVTFFLVTSLLANVINTEVGRIIYANAYYSHDQRLSTALQEIAHYPYLLLIALGLALFFAIVIVNIAQSFTNWRPLATSPAPGRGWRDFGSIWVLTTFIAIACSISQILINTYFAPIGNREDGTFPLFIMVILLIYFFIPIGIVAAIACADTLRSLQHPSGAPVVPVSQDPFAASDGSFTLSVTPITEDK